MKARLEGTGRELAYDVTVAETLLLRMKGLLGRDRLETGKGLLIRPCKGIHTFFMRFPIDAVFLDRESRIVAISRSLPPNRMTPVYRKAYSVLELPAGTVDSGTSAGDLVDLS